MKRWLPHPGLTLLLTLIWLLLVLAACQPRWLGEPVTLPQQGRDLMLAIDLSGSMDMSDMVLDGQAMNRLAAVKRVVGDFIVQRKGDRLGLILFADAAYQQTPLTYDLATVQTFLDDSQLKLVGQRTAIGEAIGLAVKRLNEYETSNKVLVLLSDGANNAGNIQPLEALALAKAAGIKIYTVGVGAEQMVQQTIFGRRTVNPSQDLDEQLLNQIASETGGQYFRARSLGELAQIYQLLDQLEPISRDNLTYRPQRSLLRVEVTMEVATQRPAELRSSTGEPRSRLLLHLQKATGKLCDVEGREPSRVLAIILRQARQHDSRNRLSMLQERQRGRFVRPLYLRMQPCRAEETPGRPRHHGVCHHVGSRSIQTADQPQRQRHQQQQHQQQQQQQQQQRQQQQHHLHQREHGLSNLGVCQREQHQRPGAEQTVWVRGHCPGGPMRNCVAPWGDALQDQQRGGRDQGGQ